MLFLPRDLFRSPDTFHFRVRNRGLRDHDLRDECKTLYRFHSCLWEASHHIVCLVSLHSSASSLPSPRRATAKFTFTSKPILMPYQPWTITVSLSLLRCARLLSDRR